MKIHFFFTLKGTETIYLNEVEFINKNNLEV